MWKSNNNAKKFAPEAAELYRSVFILRQRMMNAIQNISYYMMVEVIEPNWHVLHQNMSTVENVDDVLRVHQNFLDVCLKNCMLINSDLLKSITKLMKICTHFCDFIQVSVNWLICGLQNREFLPFFLCESHCCLKNYLTCLPIFFSMLLFHLLWLGIYSFCSFEKIKYFFGGKTWEFLSGIGGFFCGKKYHFFGGK